MIVIVWVDGCLCLFGCCLFVDFGCLGFSCSVLCFVIGAGCSCCLRFGVCLCGMSVSCVCWGVQIYACCVGYLLGLV